MSRSCSQCGNNGHNSRTCAEAGGGSSGAGSPAENGIMLFGVRVTEASSSFRKSVSMNNLSQFDQPPQYSNADAGYVSDDVVHASGRSRERKRGVPWTEEEHKLFLLGLQKVGKGDWRGISRNFVKTRTPTQVASHAQKYFLRRFNQNRRRRRSSLFDITTDTFMGSSMEVEEQAHQETVTLPQPQSQQTLTCNLGSFPVSTAYPAVLPVTGENPNSVEKFTLGTSNQKRTSATKLIRPIPILPVPPSSKMADLNLNQKPNHNHVDPFPLSLKLPTTASSEEQSPQPPTTTSHSSAFQAMSSGDSIISVA
ncbi:hypothetical protein ACOSP7_018194 [Xanthoceras sorbifolium]|uniref:Uncharacterized protein n=1 Tax=Xanthoceras sorbifolium TaxID=99658 RepID=A0ABQ8I0R3_9ROSI|nr:hypothetical protein JRO89_XS05G0066200 [Xanthoceras sorbifolium]